MPSRLTYKNFSTQVVALIVVACAVVGVLFQPHTPAASSHSPDINGDGIVNIVDLSILLSNYTSNYAPADLNGDGIVNITDLSVLLSNYGQTISSCLLTSFTSLYQPACWTPFSSSSPFNFRLPASPQLATNNTAVQGHIQTYNWQLEGGPSGFNIGLGSTRPVYFARSSDPIMNIHCTNEYGPNTCFGPNHINTDGAQIHVPSGALPGQNWDAHMIIVETDTGYEYDLYHASISGSMITAGGGSVSIVGTEDGRGSNGDAANLALLGGLLRPSELAAGVINHALVIDLPCTNDHGANVGYVWPASGGWGEKCGNYWTENASDAPPIGQLFKLNISDSQISASTAPAWEKTIMTALAHYGAYAEDTNGSFKDDNIYIFSQDPISWTSVGAPDQWASIVSQFGGHGDTLTSPVPIPANLIQLVDPCVPQGSC